MQRRRKFGPTTGLGFGEWGENGTALQCLGEKGAVPSWAKAILYMNNFSTCLLILA